MSERIERSPSRGEYFLLAALLVAPFAVYALFKYFGYSSYLKLAVAGTIAAAGATVVFTRPRWGLWVLMFYIYVGLSVPGASLGLVLLTLAGALFHLVRGQSNAMADPLFWWCVAAWTLIAIGSMVFAMTPALAIAELGRYAKCLLVMFMIVQLVRTPQDLKRLMTVIFFGAVATVVLGALGLLFGFAPRDMGVNYIREEEYFLRFTGMFPNPNIAAAVMCSSLPLGIFALKQAPRSRQPLYVLGIVILIVGMFATFSRSVVFAFTFVVVATVIRERLGKRSFIALLTLLVLAILLAPRAYWNRVLGLRDAFETTTLDWSVYLRLRALQTAWDLFLKHPFTGVGIANFADASAYNLFVRLVVHNSYLEILVGTGLFGLATFLMMVVSGVRHSLTGARHVWRRQPAWMQTASFYCLLSAGSIWISAFFGSLQFRYFPWVPVALGLVIGNLLAEDRRAE